MQTYRVSFLNASRNVIESHEVRALDYYDASTYARSTDRPAHTYEVRLEVVR